MNAWAVLNLIFVGIVGVIAIVMLWLGGLMGLNWLYWRKLHRRTRHLAPKAGQVWIQPPSAVYRIIKVDSLDGHVTVEVNGTPFGMGPLTWAHEVHAGKMFLERHELVRA